MHDTPARRQRARPLCQLVAKKLAKLVVKKLVKLVKRVTAPARRQRARPRGALHPRKKASKASKAVTHQRGGSVRDRVSLCQLVVKS